MLNLKLGLTLVACWVLGVSVAWADPVFPGPVPDAPVVADEVVVAGPDHVAPAAKAEPSNGSPSLATPAPEPGIGWPALEGVGLSLGYRPTYAGSDRHRWGLVPIAVVKWGRIRIANGGTWGDRASEGPVSGLTAELWQGRRWNLSLNLGYDRGRRSADDPMLRGLHDVPAHVRGRLRAGWTLAPGWDASIMHRFDLSGEGTGTSTDVGVSREWRLQLQDTGRPWVLSTGAHAEWMDARRAGLLFAVSPEESARTGLRAHSVREGWAALRWSLGVRHQLTEHWGLSSSVGLHRWLGDVARSPLVLTTTGWSLNFSLGRRF